MFKALGSLNRFRTFGLASVWIVAVDPAHAAERRVAVAWNDLSGGGRVQAMSTSPPFAFVTPPLTIGTGAVLRHADGKLYALSGDEGTITVIDEASWTVERVYSFGAANPLMDIAVIDPSRAYVTRGSSTHLERLDLVSGSLTQVVDLGSFADADGIPDLGMMVLFESRLFVQLPRKFRCFKASNAPALALVDVANEQLIDADPNVGGVQAIALQGACPGRKMHVVAQTRTLWVSATGGYNDFAGVERVNVDSLQSVGIFLIEGTDISSDIGPIIMVAPDRGYVVSGTDSTLSSHVRSFTLSSGVDAPEWYTSVNYDMPELEFDPQSGHLFVPEGNGEPNRGVFVFDAATGTRLTPSGIPTSGQPNDLELMCDCPVHDCSVAACSIAVPTASTWGIAVLALMLGVAGCIQIRRQRLAQ